MKKRIVIALIPFLLFSCLMLGRPEPGLAKSGSVYTVSIVPCYRHPVTGKIEDTGGESSYSVGQGMVEGCMGKTGIMEMTDDGGYYLTFRLGLIDYTKNQTFKVQKRGASGWSTPEEQGTTKTGKDSDGTTHDICVKVPAKDCIVRGSMYVQPMGRDVIWYFYPNHFKKGNTTGMKATIVTEQSKGSAENNRSASSEAKTGNGGSSNGQSNRSSTSNQSSTSGQANSGNTKGSGEDTMSASQAEGLLLSTAQQTEQSKTPQLSKNARLVLHCFAAGLLGALIVVLVALAVLKRHPGWLGKTGKEDMDDEYIYEEEEE